MYLIIQGEIHAKFCRYPPVVIIERSVMNLYIPSDTAMCLCLRTATCFGLLTDHHHVLHSYLLCFYLVSEPVY